MCICGSVPDCINVCICEFAHSGKVNVLILNVKSFSDNKIQGGLQKVCGTMELMHILYEFIS